MAAPKVPNSPQARGEHVRAARTSRGVTLRSLSQSIGVSPSTLSQIENGRTSLSPARLDEIAQVLGLSVAEILATKPIGRATARMDSTPAEFDWRVYQPLAFDSVLEAALDDFVSVGYHGATVRDIAARAKLSVPGIYHHHGSKQSMLAHIMIEAMTDLLKRAEAARDEGRDAVERFAALIENLALFHTHRIKLMIVGGAEQRSLEPANRKRVTELRVRAQRLIEEQVEQAVQEGRFRSADAKARTRAVVTMVTALPTWWRKTGPSSPEETAEQYVRFALDLMAKPR